MKTIQLWKYSIVLFVISLLAPACQKQEVNKQECQLIRIENIYTSVDVNYDEEGRLASLVEESSQSRNEYIYIGKTINIKRWVKSNLVELWIYEIGENDIIKSIYGKNYKPETGWSEQNWQNMQYNSNQELMSCTFTSKGINSTKNQNINLTWQNGNCVKIEIETPDQALKEKFTYTYSSHIKPKNAMFINFFNGFPYDFSITAIKTKNIVETWERVCYKDNQESYHDKSTSIPVYEFDARGNIISVTDGPSGNSLLYNCN